MRAALLCLVLATGCAGGADAALTAQDAKSKLAVKDNALTRLAQAELGAITQQAQQWSATHGGSMAGFADDLRSSQPSTAAAAVLLSDTSVSVAAGTGQCLTVVLPAGPVTPAAC